MITNLTSSSVVQMRRRSRRKRRRCGIPVFSQDLHLDGVLTCSSKTLPRNICVMFVTARCPQRPRTVTMSCLQLAYK